MADDAMKHDNIRDLFVTVKLFFENSLLSFLLTVALVLMSIYLYYNNAKRKYKLLPGPYGLPILGYLPFLGKEPYRTLHKLYKKYGSVYSLCLGQTRVVILGNYEAVKEAFSKSSTLDRPDNIFDFIPDGVGFSSVNGEEWTEQRKYSLKAMRDVGLGKSRWEELVQEEVEDFVKFLSSLNGQTIDICKNLTASVTNNISTLVFGTRLPLTEENAEFISRILDTIFSSSSLTSSRIYFPFLWKFFNKLGFTQVTGYRKEFKELNEFVKNHVELRKKSFADGNAQSFVDGYLIEMKNKQNQSMRSYFNDKNLRGNVQALFLGGSDTTRNSLQWLFICMASYPDIQGKVHAELDAVLGKEGKIQWSDRASVPYTYAVILEIQRWRTIAPLNTSRIATEDIKIAGYDIPKGTTIIANNWGLHNDTRYWKDPEKFQPERFLSEDGKQVNPKPESYNPFSFGKRNCPGEIVAMTEIFTYFVLTMQHFVILPPENEKPKLEGKMGLTYQAVPQKLRFIERN